MIRKWLK